MIAKVVIGAAALTDILERADKSIMQELAKTDRTYAGLCLLERLSEVARLSEAVAKFDCDAEFFLTISEREE